MKIVAVHCYSYRLPFRVPFTTAHGEMTVREGIIVELTTESGLSGIGEIAPLPAFGDERKDVRSPPLVGTDLSRPRSFSNGANFDEEADAINRSLPAGVSAKRNADAINRSLPSPAMMESLRDRTLDEALRLVYSDDMGTFLHSPLMKGLFASSLRCGLEIALLDALGKEKGCAVAALLAPVGTKPGDMIPVNAVIGAKTTEGATIAARKAIQQGYRCVKLKVAVGGAIEEEVERIAAVRAAIGPDMHLRLDANEGWHLQQAIAILSQCLPYKIQYVEQPLPAHDLGGMHTLRRAVSIPIAVDEALDGIESARHILKSEAADIFIIKPQLAGGLRASQQMIAEAAERGVRSVITSTLEAGIGVAAALHLAAASPSVTLECGLATLPLLKDDLLLSPLSVHNGFLTVPTGPGLGVALDGEVLSRYTIERF